MKKKLIVSAVCLALLALNSCNRKEMPFYNSTPFAIYPDRVEQGESRATALSPEYITSDYVSPATGIDPVIQFKFSINGRDNELPFGVNHQANIYPEGDDPVVIEVIFGEKAGRLVSFFTHICQG